jgi:hypothetical protein
VLTVIQASSKVRRASPLAISANQAQNALARKTLRKLNAYPAQNLHRWRKSVQVVNLDSIATMPQLAASNVEQDLFQILQIQLRVLLAIPANINLTLKRHCV